MEIYNQSQKYAALGGNDVGVGLTSGNYGGAVQAKRDDAIGSIMERLEHQVMQLAEACQRAERIADAISGAIPQAINTAKEVPHPGRPPFVVGSLGYINARLGDRLADLGSSLSRMESALG